MEKWQYGTPSVDLPEHAIRNRPLSVDEIYDINFNQGSDLFPVIELVAEELVFALLRSGASSEDPEQAMPLFRVGWRYGKLRLREEWASAKWEKILEVSL